MASSALGCIRLGDAKRWLRQQLRDPSLAVLRMLSCRKASFQQLPREASLRRSRILQRSQAP